MKRKQHEDRTQKFSIKMQKKLAVLFILILVAFVTLNMRLMKINKEDGEKYKKQVLSQQEYDSITLPAKRGEIVDRKGTKIAVSEKVYNVIVDAKAMLGDEGKNLETSMQALMNTDIDFNYTEQEIRAFISENPASQYRVVAKKQTYEQVSSLMEIVNNPTDYSNIKGIWLEDAYQRKYPYNTLACDVIGFVQGDNIGTYGLEEYYNDLLNGTNGREYGYLNDDENLERTIKPAQDGRMLVTTIDVNIQSIVEKHILAFNEEHKNEYREGNGSNNTGVIIMNPNNGEILAMASYPVYDLNNPRDLTGLPVDYTQGQEEGSEGVSENDVSENAVSDNAVSGNEATQNVSPDEKAELEALAALWKNFCVTDTYEPGSTMKPFTIAAGLETDKLLGNEYFVCEGALEVGDHTIHCNNLLGHGELSLQGALDKSCNVALMKMGAMLGRSTFMKYNKIFNFGLKTNIDLTGEPITTSVVFDESVMTPTDLAIGSFGQGFNVTMIQMITGFCSLINGGEYYEPHMVSEIQTADGAKVEVIEPRMLKQTISAETSETIRNMCVSAVVNGTGHSARPAGYIIGGKTGTAETYPRDKEDYVVSFIGFAPAEDPQLAIYVVIDRPNVSYQPDAKYATGLTRAILTEVLPYMKIFQTEELSEDEREELAATQQTFAVGSSGVQADGTVSGNGVSENSVSDNSVSDNHTPTGYTPPEIQYDPETGYPIDPRTGILLNPETGAPLDSSFSLID